MTEEQFIAALYEYYHIELSSKQRQQFQHYYELLVGWNQKMNLTAITDKKEVYLKHFFDSLALLKGQTWSEVKRLCDVGAGAGFPSLPLKIIYPHLEISIVDSLNKRIQFLTVLCAELGLENVHLYHERAEIFGQLAEQRESYDVVTARAVARLNVLAELCLPLVKVGGDFIALKASQGREELAEAQTALNLLGAQVQAVESFTLPNTEDRRQLFVLHKEKATPQKYPRRPGIPNKKPL